VTDFLTAIGFKVERMIFRGRYGTNVAQAMVRLRPQLRPFVTYVARAPK